MRIWFALLALLLCAVRPGAAAEPALGYPSIDTVRVHTGDDPSWAAPSFDDSGWDEIAWWRIDPQGHLMWVRAHVDLPADLIGAAEPFGIAVSGAASYEVFWNGEQVGRNGMPGVTKQAEQPGLIDASFLVPRDLLRAGDNVLAFRMSSFHLAHDLAAPIQRIVLRRYGQGRADALHLYFLTLCAVGALLLGAVYFAAMFLSNRRDVSSLLLACLSLSVLLQSLTEISRLLVSYPYPLHLLRVQLILGFASLASLLLVAYVSHRYARRWLWPLTILTGIAMGLCIGLVPGFDGKTTLVIAAALLVSLLAAAIGAGRKQLGAAGATAALAAIAALAIFDIFRFIDQAYYVAMTGLLLFMFAQQVRSLRCAERERDHAELRSARMELELLKKQIQPHFLMNSLTAVTELLESEPSAGVSMIEALADELRAISAMSGAVTVPLRQELELCEHHLKVMSFRKGVQFRLIAGGVNLDAHVPPGVFHTLIENALTHNRYTKSTAFELEEVERANKQRGYRLRTPLMSNAEGSRSSGTGHAYVRARLKEAFGTQWLFRSEAREGEWLDEIEIGAAR